MLPSPPRQELVIFIGYPCSGKTSFYRRYFQPTGYVHINQDTLRTRDKCVKAAREVLREGKSCVIGEPPLSIRCNTESVNQTTPIAIP
jgi:bifunctional polynucleotide phosphatase/kinase